MKTTIHWMIFVSVFFFLMFLIMWLSGCAGEGYYGGGYVPVPYIVPQQQTFWQPYQPLYPSPAFQGSRIDTSFHPAPLIPTSF